MSLNIRCVLLSIVFRGYINSRGISVTRWIFSKAPWIKVSGVRNS